MVRDLRTELTGRRFEKVTAEHPKIVRFPLPAVFCRSLTGRTVTGVERRGKFIICRLDSDDDLVTHLGMTGHLLVTQPTVPEAPHTHVRALLDDGRELRYDDARRFGRMLLGPREILESAHVLPRLGIEPLGEHFTPEAFATALKGTTRQLKAALLDQSRVAGLGNIYIDEACHLAGIRPTRRAHRLRRNERAALRDAIVAILTTAVDNRGSSVDTYRDVWNAQGKNQEVLRVYGRGGEPCLRCGRALKQTVVGGRTTVFCQECQR